MPALGDLGGWTGGGADSVLQEKTLVPSRMPVSLAHPSSQAARAGGRRTLLPGAESSPRPGGSRRCLREAGHRGDTLNHFKAATSALGWGLATEIQKRSEGHSKTSCSQPLPWTGMPEGPRAVLASPPHTCLCTRTPHSPAHTLSAPTLPHACTRELAHTGRQLPSCPPVSPPERKPRPGVASGS